MQGLFRESAEFAFGHDCHRWFQLFGRTYGATEGNCDFQFGHKGCDELSYLAELNLVRNGKHQWTGDRGWKFV